MHAKEFLTKVKDSLLDHDLFLDPFIHSFSHIEELDIATAKKFAELYYPHILRTRLYQASALAICPDERIQYVLSDILHDEYGLGNIEHSHMQQYRDFMIAVGATIKPANDYAIIPELQLYISAMEQLTRNGDWLAAVAAVGIASEWPIPKYYDLLLQGLRKIPGIKESDLKLFTGHVELDIEHSNMIEQAILPYVNSESGQQRVTKGIELNMNARRVLHHGLYKAIFC